MPRGGIAQHYADIGDAECRRRNHGACRNYWSAAEARDLTASQRIKDYAPFTACSLRSGSTLRIRLDLAVPTNAERGDLNDEMTM